MGEPATKLATAGDLARLPESAAAEVVAGVIVYKAVPTFDHGLAQGNIGESLGSFKRRPRGGGPGGWWIVPEVEVEYEPHEVYRHDLVGWRRDRVPERPADWPVHARPDWACEVLSPSNWANDTVKKFATLQRHGGPHYWLVDLDRRVLTVFRLVSGLYAVATHAEPGERKRLEPFDALELEVAVLFGDDPADQ